MGYLFRANPDGDVTVGEPVDARSRATHALSVSLPVLVGNGEPDGTLTLDLGARQVRQLRAALEAKSGGAEPEPDPRLYHPVTGWARHDLLGPGGVERETGDPDDA